MCPLTTTTLQSLLVLSRLTIFRTRSKKLGLPCSRPNCRRKILNPIDKNFFLFLFLFLHAFVSTARMAVNPRPKLADAEPQLGLYAFPYVDFAPNAEASW